MNVTVNKLVWHQTPEMYSGMVIKVGKKDRQGHRSGGVVRRPVA